jgi:hypothetical protein
MHQKWGFSKRIGIYSRGWVVGAAHYELIKRRLVQWTRQRAVTAFCGRCRIADLIRIWCDFECTITTEIPRRVRY